MAEPGSGPFPMWSFPIGHFPMYFNGEKVYLSGLEPSGASCSVHNVFQWHNLHRAVRNVLGENLEKRTLRTIDDIYFWNLLVHCSQNIVTIIMTFQFCHKLQLISRILGILKSGSCSKQFGRYKQGIRKVYIYRAVCRECFVLFSSYKHPSHHNLRQSF